jgi:hypothetical protein
MATSREPTAPTAEAIDRFCGHVDDLFARSAERTAVRHYLTGLLLLREYDKTLTGLAALICGTIREVLVHLTAGASLNPVQSMGGVIQCRFDFDRQVAIPSAARHRTRLPRHHLDHSGRLLPGL